MNLTEHAHAHLRIPLVGHSSEVNPDEVVAMGAAVQAGVLAGEVKDKLVDVGGVKLCQGKNSVRSMRLKQWISGDGLIQCVFNFPIS